MRYSGPLAPRLPFPSRARGATTGSDTAAAAAAAATSSGSGSETGGGWADAPNRNRGDGLVAPVRHAADDHHREQPGRTMTRTDPFTTRIPTAMSSRSITLLPDPRGGVYRVLTPSSPPARASLREECSGGDDGRAPCPPRSPISSMRPSRPRLPGSGCTPRAGRSRSRRRTPSVGRAASALAELGVRPGELVLATARNTPEYLFAWLGATYARRDHRRREPPRRRERARRPHPPGAGRGSSSPTRPPHQRCASPAARRSTWRPCTAGRQGMDPAAAGPRRSGGADPDVGHDRAVEARDADAPRLRDGGGGVPVVDGAHRRRPADDVAAALPHQRAGVLDARVGRRAGRAWCCCRGFSASTFLDAARRFGATEFNSIGAMLEILDAPARARPTTPTTRCASVTRARRPTAERQLEIEARFGFEIVCGYALSESPYGTDLARTARGRTARSGRSRQHPTLGHVNDARVVDDDGAVVGRARSASSSCATPRSCAATTRCPRRPRR